MSLSLFSQLSLASSNAAGQALITPPRRHREKLPPLSPEERAVRALSTLTARHAFYRDLFRKIGFQGTVRDLAPHTDKSTLALRNAVYTLRVEGLLLPSGVAPGEPRKKGWTIYTWNFPADTHYPGTPLEKQKEAALVSQTL